MADAPDVLRAVTRGEPEIVGQPVPDVVAVEHVRRLAAVDQAAFERPRDRGFARRRQSCEQNGCAALVDRRPSLVAGERCWLPRQVPAAPAPRLDHTRGRDHSSPGVAEHLGHRRIAVPPGDGMQMCLQRLEDLGKFTKLIDKSI